MSEEKFYYQTEAAELLNMMISSVYSNKDIFLRELISNASDALDKRRIECLKDSELAENEHPEIRIDTDADAKTLSVSDNGIGMTRDEIIQYLGTIAKSGTKEFLRAAKDANTQQELIGQFGVGFYSVFMVAEKVEVVTRKLGGSETFKFTSDGGGSFTVEDAPQRSECGTTVTLFMRGNTDEGAKDYLSEWTVRDIVGKYSDFISWPIFFKDKILNSQKAIWQRPESDVSDEEYSEFYKHLTHDYSEPLARIKINAEGTTNFKGLLFIPSQAPFDFFMNPDSGGISLYINRVFIMNDCKDLIPQYMKFVRGVIDSEDLPLNISREILQDDPITRIIRRSTQRKVFGELRKILEDDREKYAKFWTVFGRAFKEGIAQDPENAKTILDLAIFRTTHDDGWTTLSEYESRMKPDQKGVYCLAGNDNVTALKASPKLEPFTSRGYEVLLMTDPIDEFILAQADFILPKDSKDWLNIARDDVTPYTDDEKKADDEKLKELDAEFEPLKKLALEILPDKLESVKLSTSLTSSPACLRDGSGGLSLQMERLMRAAGRVVPPQKRVLELGANHPAVKRLAVLAETDRDKAGEILRVLYGQSVLLEGEMPENPAEFVRLVDGLMLAALGDA